MIDAASLSEAEFDKHVKQVLKTKAKRERTERATQPTNGTTIADLIREQSVDDAFDEPSRKQSRPRFFGA